MDAHRTRIKFCGMTRPEDALAGARAGCDAIGLVFYKPVARYVTPAAASAILEVLPPFVTPVALFVDAPLEEVVEIASSLRLRHIQLHGNESPEYVAALRGFSVIKAIRLGGGDAGAEVGRWRKAIDRLHLNHLKALLLETSGTAAPGGSGVANDWGAIARLRETGAFEGLPPLIAAGGLTPENVGSVVRDLNCWAVDVSSGVEREKGKKSPELMRAFVRAVRETES
jgi:phosphoribosylanthranilate isomerase